MSKMSGPLVVIPGANTANSNRIDLASVGSDHTNPTVNLRISGTANTAAADIPSITNAAHGQASVYTIADCGQAAGTFAVSTGGTVSTVSVTLTPAQVVTAYTAGIVLVAAPGAGQTLILQEASMFTASTGHTAYATGGVGVIQYDTTAHGAGTNALSGTIAAANVTAAS